MFSQISPQDAAVQARAAMVLRIGLGLVFVVGGIAKLERLLTPAKAEAIVTEYVGPAGYINQTFLEWLFDGSLPAVVTPWSFLTLLSAFELVAGLMLIVGLLVRPLAVLWALLLWSFVVSLPVVTTPGVDPVATTYQSPAAMVQIRDIALSGFFFVLYNLGPGAWSLDARRFGLPPALGRNWEPLALLLRLSLASVFLVGGFFHGFDKITSYGMPAVLLAAIGLGLLAGLGVRYFAMAAGLVLVVVIAGKLPDATSVIGYFNAVKREFGLLAAAGVLTILNGGRMFALDRGFTAFAASLKLYTRGPSAR